MLRALRSHNHDNHDHLRKALAEAPRALDALRTILVEPPIADAIGTGTRRGRLMANSTLELGLLFMSRTGLDTATLTATARSLADRLLPDHHDG